MKITNCPYCKNPMLVPDYDGKQTIRCDAPRCQKLFVTKHSSAKCFIALRSGWSWNRRIWSLIVVLLLGVVVWLGFKVYQNVADQHYAAEIRSLLDTMRPQLRDGAIDQTLRSLENAASGEFKADPVVESLIEYFERRRLDPRAWSPEEMSVVDETVRDCSDWNRTRFWNFISSYQSFLAKHPDSPFAHEASKRLVDLEVAQISGGKHGALPPAEEIERVEGRKYSIVNVHNDTSYALTLRYSGQDSFKVVFASGERGSIEVQVGTYKMAASVDAPDVQNYVGSETSSGGNYEVRYYIQHSVSSIHIPDPTWGLGNSGMHHFEAWKNKRQVPAYLK
jgi:hypothetical protein